jgi:hypothetical protein
MIKRAVQSKTAALSPSYSETDLLLDFAGRMVHDAADAAVDLLNWPDYLRSRMIVRFPTRGNTPRGGTHRDPVWGLVPYVAIPHSVMFRQHFFEYTRYKDDPEIGQVMHAGAHSVVALTAMHEVAHAVHLSLPADAFPSRDRGQTHGKQWQAMYRVLRHWLRTQHRIG